MSRASSLSPTQQRQIHKAVRLRQKLTNKALSIKHNVSIGTISRCIGGRKR